MRLLAAFLLSLFLSASPAAQTLPASDALPVANASVPGADFLRSGGAEPDTTSPWRYFPLHVGDAWEYYYYGSGARRRVDVLGEETHLGRDYFTWRSRTYTASGQQVGSFGPRPVRFDTVDTVVKVYVSETGEESFLPLPWTRCPLDAAFGSEVVCPHREEDPFEVGGGYDGLLVFGTDLPGTGEDTIRTAVKTYYSFVPGNSEDFRYGADLGLVFLENELGAEGLYYARVDGVEHGQAVYPVESEAGPEVTLSTLVLSTYPNPFREHLRVDVAGTMPEGVVVEVVDVLGRVVRREEVRGPGAITVSVEGRGLAPGLYVVRVRNRGGSLATQKVLKL